MIKNIIFDLDGTLIDSMYIWNEAGRNFLIKNNITPPKNLEEIFKTMTFTESAQFFINKLGLKLTVDEIINGIIYDVKDLYLTSVELKPGVAEFIKKCDSSNINMCILTSSELDYIIPCLKKLKIFDYFKEILTCTNLGMSKSSPEIYIKASEKFKFKISETAVFEDALHCIESSIKAGFFTIGVYDETTSNEVEHLKNICNKFIYSFEELI